MFELWYRLFPVEIPSQAALEPYPGPSHLADELRMHDALKLISMPVCPAQKVLVDSQLLELLLESVGLFPQQQQRCRFHTEKVSDTLPVCPQRNSSHASKCKFQDVWPVPH